MIPKIYFCQLLLHMFTKARIRIIPDFGEGIDDGIRKTHLAIYLLKAKYIELICFLPPNIKYWPDRRNTYYIYISSNMTPLPLHTTLLSMVFVLILTSLNVKPPSAPSPPRNYH